MAPDTHCVLGLIFLGPKAAKNHLLSRESHFFSLLFHPELTQQGAGEAEGVKNLQTAHDYAKEKQGLNSRGKNITFF